MPTSTFYNLPKDKKNRVINAAIDEFIRVENGEVIIKNIINQAGIPRGGFYQYFESREDLVDYIMKNRMFKDEQDFVKKIQEVDGDILIAFEKFFSNTISGKNKDRLILEKKIIEYVKNSQERNNTENKCIHPPKLIDLGKILKYLDTSKYKVETVEELETIFHMLMGIMIKNMVDFQNGNSKEKAIKAFKRDLDYLRYGIIKK